MFLSRRAAVLALALVLVSTALVLHAPRVAAASGPAGTLTGPMSDSGLDTDGDGRSDYLAINVTVDVTSPGMFAIRANLAQFADVRALLDVGIQTMQARVYGWSLWNAGFDGPYNVSLTLANGLNLTVLDTASYTTGYYRAKAFDPPTAIIESVGTAWPVDTNSNGLYDELRLNYTLNVTSTDAFEVRGHLSAVTPGCCGDLSWIDTPLVAVGVHALTFSIPGGLINNSAMWGPFSYSLYVVQWYRESPSMSVGYSVSWKSVTTPIYYWFEFEPPWVRMVPPFSDLGVDLDGDGLLEEIAIRVPIHLDRAANVTVTGTISNPYYVSANNHVSQPLPAGDTSVDLVFSTFLWRRFNVSGPFTATIDLVSSVLPGTVERESYTTTAYNYTQFSPPSASMSPGKWTAVDTDADGKIDRLGITVNVTAAKTGDYFVDAELYTGGYPDVPPVQGRFLHLSAGARAEVTLWYSGITLNRTAWAAPWAAYPSIVRLDSIQGDNAGTVLTTPYNRSAFASPAAERLNVSVHSAATGNPVPYARVVAVDPAHVFWTWGQTDAFGNASIPLYNGTFTVTADTPGGIPEYQGVAQSVSVNGATAANLDLPRMPESRMVWNATLTAWNVTRVSLQRTWTYGNASARVVSDIVGNFDGVANATELTWWMRYPVSLPYPYPVAFPRAGALTLSVDDASLAPGPEAVTLLQGAGPYTSTQAIVTVANTTFRSAGAPPAGLNHRVDVSLFYDQAGLDANLTLHLPPGTASTASASANVSLFHPTPTTWIVDPGRTPTAGNLFATASVAAIAADTTPPTGRFTPGTAERGVALALDGSASTDDVGVVNYTWNVTMNGTMHRAYGAQVTFTFPEIGAFVVTLVVSDAAGNAATVSHVAIVRDTTPPPPPTGLIATISQSANGAGVFLTWSAVSVDDLASYRVYRSGDNGTTFTRIAQIAAGTSLGDGPGVGAFVYRVTAVDRYGNEGAPSASVQVVVPASTGPAPNVSGIDVWAILAVVILAGGAVAAAVVFLMRRRPKPPPSERGPVV